MSLLDTWDRREHTRTASRTRRTARARAGRHRDPRDPGNDAGGDRVRARRSSPRGSPWCCPHLFGEPEAPMNPVTRRQVVAPGVRQPRVHQARHRRRRRRSPAGCAAWPGELHDELGGPGVGALGMCFTGGFALAMMVDASVAAPVLAQPSAPFAVTPGRVARPQPLPRRPGTVQGTRGRRLRGPRPALPQGPRRRQPLRDPDPRDRRRLHPRRVRGQGPLDGHRPHRQQEAVDRVLAFFAEKLR